MPAGSMARKIFDKNNSKRDKGARVHLSTRCEIKRKLTLKFPNTLKA
jgi:hypothetical protein